MKQLTEDILMSTIPAGVAAVTAIFLGGWVLTYAVGALASLCIQHKIYKDYIKDPQDYEDILMAQSAVTSQGILWPIASLLHLRSLVRRILGLPETFTGVLWCCYDNMNYLLGFVEGYIRGLYDGYRRY